MKYSVQELINTHNGSFKKSDFVFFWGHSGNAVHIGKSCLSQWFPSTFTANGETYNCAEQYMMAAKAFTFGDREIYRRILAESDQAVMKGLGRRVRNFWDYIWKANRHEVVLCANVNKFSQNRKLADYLLSTGDKILVEASPYDDIWGIGLDENHPEAIDPRRWKGQNLLGFILMEVRDILRGTCENTADNINKVLAMWTQGAGNSSKRLMGEDPMPKKLEKADSRSWATHPMRNFVKLEQDHYINATEMERLSYGHVPDAMEDHWFMYCDEQAIRYYRSWTGIPVYEAYYSKCGKGFKITEIRINNTPGEYMPCNLDASIALFYALMISDFGGYSAPYYNAAFQPANFH